MMRLTCDVVMCYIHIKMPDNIVSDMNGRYTKNKKKQLRTYSWHLKTYKMCGGSDRKCHWYRLDNV